MPCAISSHRPRPWTDLNLQPALDATLDLGRGGSAGRPARVEPRPVHVQECAAASTTRRGGAAEPPRRLPAAQRREGPNQAAARMHARARPRGPSSCAGLSYFVRAAFHRARVPISSEGGPRGHTSRAQRFLTGTGAQKPPPVALSLSPSSSLLPTQAGTDLLNLIEH